MPALIFDCDGVLADTERDGHLPAFNAAFEEFGLPIRWSEAEYAEKLRIGGGKERIASAFTPDLDDAIGVNSEAERAEWIARLHKRKTALFTERVDAGLLPGRPGVRRLIAEALAADWTVAVASTSAETSVRAVLEHVAEAADAAKVHVFAGDIVAQKKPAPDIYLTVMADLGLEPSECVVIEDSGIGVAAASGAGLTTVVTVSAFTAEDDFAGAALVLNQLGDPEAPTEVIDVNVDGPGLPVAANLLVSPHFVTLHDLSTLISRAKEQ